MLVEECLALGELEIHGRLAGASNATLFCTVTNRAGLELKCVYKPVRGERPLWDFPEGTLAAREVAAYELNLILGWDLIPVTVWRDDGPHGAGMCQLWIDEGESEDLVDVVTSRVVRDGWRHVLTGESEYGDAVHLIHADRSDLQQMALLDVVMNNADRKAGHLLIDKRQKLWGIDHGLTFNDEPKLRTVLWGWSGQAVPEDLLVDVDLAFAQWDELESALSPWLLPYELEACAERFRELLRTKKFPQPPTYWPAVPWPLY